jgi:hypothetical protein
MDPSLGAVRWLVRGLARAARTRSSDAGLGASGCLLLRSSLRARLGQNRFVA